MVNPVLSESSLEFDLIQEESPMKAPLDPGKHSEALRRAWDKELEKRAQNKPAEPIKALPLPVRQKARQLARQKLDRKYPPKTLKP